MEVDVTYGEFKAEHKDGMIVYKGNYINDLWGLYSIYRLYTDTFDFDNVYGANLEKIEVSEGLLLLCAQNYCGREFSEEAKKDFMDAIKSWNKKYGYDDLHIVCKIDVRDEIMSLADNEEKYIYDV